MAEACARQYGGAEVDVWSAGIEPRAVDPHLRELLEEIGIHDVEPVSRPVTAGDMGRADVVVTLCDPDEAACPPPPPGVRHVNWTIPGPSHFSSDRRDGLRAVRDAIVAETLWLLAELGGAP